MQHKAEIDHQTAGKPLNLPPPYTIRNAETIYDTIRDALLNQSSIMLALSDDADPDLSFFQLIEIARQYAAMQNKQFLLEKPVSPQVREKLRIAGLATTSDGEFHRFWFHEEAFQ